MRNKEDNTIGTQGSVNFTKCFMILIQLSFKNQDHNSMYIYLCVFSALCHLLVYNGTQLAWLKQESAEVCVFESSKRFFFLRRIWKERNGRVFNQQRRTWVEVARGMAEEKTLWRQANSAIPSLVLRRDQGRQN